MKKILILLLLLSALNCFAEEEIISRRSEKCKLFKLSKPRQYRVEANIGSIHYKENPDDAKELWKDIDTTIVGNQVTKAPYIAEFDLTRPWFKIYHRKGGYVIEETTQDDGTSIAKVGVLKGNKITYSDVFPDVDVEIIARSNGVKQNLIIKNKQAFREFFHIKTESDNQAVILNETQIKFGRLIEQTGIWDANGEEIEFEREYEDGVLKIIAPEDASELAYPVTIDPDVMPEEVVGASTDDAHNRGNVYPGDGNYSGTYSEMYLGCMTVDFRLPGFRFTTIPIPKDATIDSAQLSFKASYTRNKDCHVYVAAEDTDSAVTFAATTHEPYDAYLARTTAVYTWDIGTTEWVQDNWYGGSGQTSENDIKSVVEEVVARGGWSENNDIVFVSWNVGESLGWYDRRIRTYNSAPDRAAKFTCTYTAGAPPAVGAQPQILILD